MAAKVYYEKDADLNLLKNKVVGIIGYGSQGHAQAQNLRDSGVKVIVSEIKDTPNYKLAVSHKFTPMSAAELTRKADIIQILVPDEYQAALYEKEIKPNLTAGKAIMFSHGFNINFKQIVPEKNIDVFMSARAGHLVRSELCQGRRRSLSGGGVSECDRQGQEDRPGLRQRYRRSAGRDYRNHVSGRDRNRFVRGTGGSLRRCVRTGEPGF